ncbi:MAG: hypothetical protein ACRESK_08620, partial [Gammaproteobacteria bacterium]
PSGRPNFTEYVVPIVIPDNVTSSLPWGLLHAVNSRQVINGKIFLVGNISLWYLQEQIHSCIIQKR